MEKLFESSGMVVKSYVYLIILQFTVNLSCKSQGMDRTVFLTRLSWIKNKEHLGYLTKASWHI